MEFDKEAELRQQNARIQADVERKFAAAVAKSKNPSALKPVIDRLRSVGFNDTYLNTHNLMALPAQLQANEVINYATSGVDDQTQAAALIVVTNQRVILIDNHLIVSAKVITIDPTKIVRIKALRGFVLGTLILHLTPHRVYRISSIALPTFDSLLDALHALIDDDQDPDQAVEVDDKRID